jgi:hypothetical protein
MRTLLAAVSAAMLVAFTAPSGATVNPLNCHVQKPQAAYTSCNSNNFSRYKMEPRKEAHYIKKPAPKKPYLHKKPIIKKVVYLKKKLEAKKYYLKKVIYAKKEKLYAKKRYLKEKLYAKKYYLKQKLYAKKAYLKKMLHAKKERCSTSSYCYEKKKQSQPMHAYNSPAPRGYGGGDSATSGLSSASNTVGNVGNTVGGALTGISNTAGSLLR